MEFRNSRISEAQSSDPSLGDLIITEEFRNGPAGRDWKAYVTPAADVRPEDRGRWI
jgi:hypothetical protein